MTIKTKDKKILKGRGPVYYIPLEKFDLLKNTLYKYLNRGVTGLSPGYIISGPWPEFTLLT